MSQARPTTPEIARPGAFSSRLRILRFRWRQAVIWWLQTTLASPLAAGMVLAGDSLRVFGFRRRGLKLLLGGRRLARNSRADAAIRDIVAQDNYRATEFVELLRPLADNWIASCAERALILKAPRLANGEVVEKGALTIKFTETFEQLFQGLDVHRLAEYFRIVLEPSWVGYSLPSILVWTQLSPEKVIVMAPYQPDYDLLQALGSNLVPVPLGPADWVNPTRFNKITGVEKIYDAIYVANYNPKKRVDRFLRAVVNVSRTRPDYRAALVCAGHGKEQFGLVIQETAAWAQRKANLDLFAGVNQAQLNELFNKAKVNVLLSLREGMNKGLAEGLFAGTPALLLAESACGNHRHINPENGRVVADSELEETLAWFADNYAKFRPDEWAKAHISPAANTARLSRELRQLETSEGRTWTKNLWVKVNQPEMRYLDHANDHLYAERLALLKAFARAESQLGLRDFMDHLVDVTNGLAPPA